MRPNLRSTLIRASSVSLAVAGAMLIAKAGVILLTGYQPPLIYEGGQTLFAAGLLGLYLVLRRAGALGRIGAGLAAIGAGCGAALLVGTSMGAAQTNSVQFVMPWSLLYLALGPGSMLALMLLGVSVFRTRATGSLDATPLLLGILPLVLMVAALVHVEAPILLIGASWIALGVWLFGRAEPWKERSPELLGATAIR